MIVEVQDDLSPGNAPRGRWRVLSVIVLYIVLAVAVGAARSALQNDRASPAPPPAAEAGGL
jgi:hypothetical protein